MKRLFYVVAAGALLIETSCSTIDASTANSVPSTDGYTNSVRSTNTAGGSDPSVVGRANVPNAMDLSGAGSATKPLSDVSFVLEAGSSSMLEKQLAEMAVQKATHPEVKQFAQMIIDHHTELNQDLEPIAARLDADLAQSLNKDQQETITKLSKLSGAKFNEEYIQTMVQLHQLDISKYNMISNSGQDIALKAFAAKTLPLLQSHYNKAAQLESKVD